MSWVEAGRMVLLITLANVAGLLWSGEAKLWVWLVYLLAGAGAVGLSARRWKRRVNEIAAAAPEERDARLAALTGDDLAAARLELGLVTADDAGVDPKQGETLRYPRTPPLLMLLLLWGCVAMSALPLTLLFLGKVRADQVLWAFLVGLGFAVGAWGAIRAARAEAATISVTPAGLVERPIDGPPVGRLWSEVVLVRIGAS